MTKEKKQKRVQYTRKKEESLSYTVEVRDKEGRVLQRVSAPSHSYVQQWNQVLNVPASHASKTVKDTEGIAQNVDENTTTFAANAPIGTTSYGLRVGKGTTPVAITDYSLETPLGHGTGVDEFNHQAVTFTEPSVVGSTCSFTLSRTMINNSGATITGIKEIGCYIRGDLYVFLGFRDVLPSAVYVPNGGAITVIYTIKVTV